MTLVTRVLRGIILLGDIRILTILSIMLCNSFLDHRFEWLNHPEEWFSSSEEDSGAGDVEGSGGRVTVNEHLLMIRPAARKDFWSKTFYIPPLIKADACGYIFDVPTDDEITVRVDFHYKAIEQFDQAGLLLYINDQTWMKCGIEFCDGVPRLSVVVTNQGYSDWSTQPWTENGHSNLGARLKVHRITQANSLVVEAARLDSEDFGFIRIAHLHPSSAETSATATWRIGPFAACPGPQHGCEAYFSNFLITKRESTAHDPVWH